MKEQLINFETAKLAKEKGFPQRGNRCFLKDGISIRYNSINHGRHLANNMNDNPWVNFAYIRPSQSILQKWLREKYDIIVGVDFTNDGKYYTAVSKYPCINTLYYAVNYNSYEEALEIGLQEALKLIPDEK